MAGAQSVWGIDMGRCALKAMKLRIGAEEKVELVAHDYVEHPKILTQPDADRDELIANALEKFLSRNDLTNDKVVISVPGQQTLARFSKLPPVDARTIPNIVKYEADQQIPFDMDEVIWDYQTFQQEDLPDVEVGIFAMKRELIHSHLLPFEQVGIEPIIVQSSPLAVYNAVHYEGMLKDDQTTIILDIGAAATDLIVATPYSLWTRTIQIGGNRFTEALVKSFKLSFSKAENLKRTAASSRYARQIFQAMRPVFAELVQELQRSIGFYSATHRGANIDRIIGLGNAFRLPGLQKYLQQNMSHEVEVPKRFTALGASEAARAPVFVENLLTFAAPYGLALQGLEQAKIVSNLLPMEIAKQVVWRRKQPFIAAAAACLLLAGGLPWLRYNLDSSALADGQKNGPALVRSDAEAITILENGPNASTDREKAGLIVAAAQRLKTTYGTLKSSGETERREAEEIVSIQQYRAMVPMIVARLHDAIADTDQPFVQAESLEAYLESLRAEGMPPRSQRPEIQVQSFDMTYVSDTGAVELENATERKPNFPELSKGVALPGFIVTLICRSPNKDHVKFIEPALLDKLQEFGRKPNMGFCINRVYLQGMTEVKPGETAQPTGQPGGRPTPGGFQPPRRPGGGFQNPPSDHGAPPSDHGAPPSDHGAPGGREGPVIPGFQSPPMPGVPAQPTLNPQETKAGIDLITGEERQMEWVYTINLDVLLQDAPAAQDASAAQGGAASPGPAGGNAP